MDINQLFYLFFCDHVDAIERIKPLVLKSQENLSDLNIHNVKFKHGDGFIDWSKSLKYDGILCAAAPRSYPEDLISILKTDAKLVIPVGGSNQVLKTIKKIDKDEVEEITYDDVSFVPMLAGISEDGINL